MFLERRGSKEMVKNEEGDGEEKIKMKEKLKNLFMQAMSPHLQSA